MSRRGSVPGLGRGAIRTLAVLLLVDGRVIPAQEIAAIAAPWGGSRKSVKDWWIPALRAHGCRIETANPYGYRLQSLPPDALLLDVLAVAHDLRAEQPTRLWHLLGLAERPPTVKQKTERSRTRIAA